MTRNLRVAFVGFGVINSRVADLLKQRGAPVEIVGVATKMIRSNARGFRRACRFSPHLRSLRR